MTPESIAENNKAIALWMEASIHKDSPTMKIWLDDSGDGTLFYCEWHPDFAEGTNIVAWDWRPDKNWCQLMPVVNRIESTGEGFDVIISNKECTIMPSDFMSDIESIHFEADTKLSATYQAVWQFIKEVKEV